MMLQVKLTEQFSEYVRSVPTPQLTKVILYGCSQSFFEVTMLDGGNEVGVNTSINVDADTRVCTFIFEDNLYTANPLTLFFTYNNAETTKAKLIQQFSYVPVRLS
jgi:hypothetical protein